MLERLGIHRSHQAVWQWVYRHADSVSDLPRASPRRVAVDETAVQIRDEWRWLYVAIDLDSKLLLGVRLSQRRGTTPAAAFLRDLIEQNDLSEAWFLIDGTGYLTALARLGLSGDLDYVDRNLIEKWFQTLKMRANHFYNTWNGSAALAALPAPSTTISTDRTKRSMVERQSRRCRNGD